MLNIPNRSFKPGDVLSEAHLLDPFNRVATLSNKDPLTGVALLPAPNSINVHNIDFSNLDRDFRVAKSGTTGQFDLAPVAYGIGSFQFLAHGNSGGGAEIDFTATNPPDGILLKPNQLIRVSGSVTFVEQGVTWANTLSSRFWIVVWADMETNGTPFSRVLGTASGFDFTNRTSGASQSSDTPITHTMFRTISKVFQCPFETWNSVNVGDLGDAEADTIYLQKVYLQVITGANVAQAIMLGDWNLNFILDSL